MSFPIVVTGGSSGIGFHICQNLCLKNYPVILTARNVEKCQQAVQKIKDANAKAKIDFVSLEVTQVDNHVISEIQLVAKRLVPESEGQISALINNAGISADMGWGQDPDEKSERNKRAKLCLETNFLSILKLNDLSKAILKTHSTIINVSSGGAFMNINKMSKDMFKRIETATREELDDLVVDYLKAYEKNADAPCLDKENGFWLHTYGFSKVLLNRGTEIQSEDLSFIEKDIKINAVSPGFCKSSITRGYGQYESLLEPSDGANVVIGLLSAKTTGSYYDAHGVYSCLHKD